MSDGAEKDYKFGPKNNWRQWKWNRIRERLSVHPRDATALYFAAKEDHDWKAASRHGFSRVNMIAVERDAEVHRSLRESGILAIHGDAFDVVYAWPKSKPIHVLDFDFCGGASDSLRKMIIRMPYQKHLSKCVVSFNMLRGRDDFGGVFFKISEQVGRGRWSEVSSRYNVDYRHRGLLVFVVFAFIGAIFIDDKELMRRGLPGLPISENSIPSPSQSTLQMLMEASKPVFNSYKSGVLTYDSVVFQNPFISTADNLHHECNKRATKGKTIAIAATHTRYMKEHA